MNTVERIFEWLLSAWNAELLKLGDTPFTVRALILVIISLVLLSYLSAKFKKLLVERVFPHYNLERGVSLSIATIIRYVIIILGIFIIFQTSGIDLSALALLFGALGVGIGFGLQGITNNFISGVIILFERPIKVGDRVEVDDIVGRVDSISGRATTIITNDNIGVIVPNSDFINQRVINWSLNDRNVRLNFPVGVSYKEDPEVIRKLLLAVARENPGVLQHPKPDVLFDQYGDSSLDFILRVWTNQFSDTPKILKSELYYAIFEKFNEHGIEIPYPQRDVHLKSGFGQIENKSG
jgi:small-conductance mechanosensitive channel